MIFILIRTKVIVTHYDTLNVFLCEAPCILPKHITQKRAPFLLCAVAGDFWAIYVQVSMCKCVKTYMETYLTKLYLLIVSK